MQAERLGQKREYAAVRQLIVIDLSHFDDRRWHDTGGPSLPELQACGVTDTCKIVFGVHMGIDDEELWNCGVLHADIQKKMDWCRWFSRQMGAVYVYWYRLPSEPVPAPLG